MSDLLREALSGKSSEFETGAMIVGGFRPFKTKNPKIVANELIDQYAIQMERDAFAARDQSDHSIAGFCSGVS